MTDQSSKNLYVRADAVAMAPADGTPWTATWTPALPRRDEYEVYARWVAAGSYAADAPYTIHHESGSTTVTKNQQTNGGSWQLLGTFVMAPGQNHRVTLADTATGQSVIADAVKFVPKANVTKTAAWTVSVGTTGSYGIYAKWPASNQHATDVPYTVTHAGGASTVTVNQRVNGGQWNLLGTWSFDSGTDYKVELSDAVTAGKVAADAIYIAPAGAPPSDAFTWTPAIPSSGIYQLYARWPASSANAGAAQYTVTHGGGTANVTLNQKQNGGSWVPLGSWSLAPGAGHKVTLAASADGTTIADALLFVGAGAQPANLLYVHADHLGSPQKMTDASQATVWDGVFDPFGEEVAITGLAAMPMRFPGQYADEETGFSYNYFRDYEPQLGRYMQTDPIGLLASVNTYSYVRQQPTGFIDAKGLDSDNGIRIPIPYFTPPGTSDPGALNTAIDRASNNATRNWRRFWQWCRDIIQSAIRSSPREEPCNRAYTRCKNWNPNDKAHMTRCAQSLDQCLKTDLPVIFPDGTVVKPDGGVENRPQR